MIVSANRRTESDEREEEGTKVFTLLKKEWHLVAGWLLAHTSLPSPPPGISPSLHKQHGELSNIFAQLGPSLQISDLRF